MHNEDLTYFRQRSQAERALAERSQDRAVAAVHAQLAELYAQRVLTAEAVALPVR